MSFIGGPQYMYAHYLDALAICRKLGNPRFFITFTCNVKWPEIRRYMVDYPELTASDRPDIVCRSTTLTEWFAYNAANADGRHLTYLDFPSQFVWYGDRKSRSPRQNSKSFVGRLAAACEALGLLEDDNEWDIAMQEACASAMSS
ncbi:DNA helicase [Tanacetum coccineum]